MSDDTNSNESNLENFDYVCPVCRSDVTKENDRYVCISCNQVYPIYFGIPDFRLSSDPYLSLKEEIAKAEHLFRFGREHSFDELIREYYRITDDVPTDMAEKFASYIHAGPARAGIALDCLQLSKKSKILDIGCATGGFIISAVKSGHRVVGVDIAMRWLVICAKRMSEEGVSAHLVCADVDALPFKSESFDGGVAIDFFEHVPNLQNALAAVNSVLSKNGRIFVAGVNRFTITPFPLAGLWGVGFLPSAIRRRYIIAKRGIDTLRHANLFSPFGLATQARCASFGIETIQPLAVADEYFDRQQKRRPFLVALYSRLRRLPVFRQILVAIGPAFQFTAIKRQNVS